MFSRGTSNQKWRKAFVYFEEFDKLALILSSITITMILHELQGRQYIQEKSSVGRNSVSGVLYQSDYLSMEQSLENTLADNVSLNSEDINPEQFSHSGSRYALESSEEALVDSIFVY